MYRWQQRNRPDADLMQPEGKPYYLLVPNMNLAGAVGGGVELLGEVVDNGTVRHGIEETQVLLHLDDLRVHELECRNRWPSHHP